MNNLCTDIGFKSINHYGEQLCGDHIDIIEQNEKVSVCAVKFSDKLFYDFLGDICDLNDFPIVVSLSEEDYTVARELFNLLLSEEKNSLSLASEKFASNIIEQLVIITLRAAGYKKCDAESGWIRKALIYIHYNFRRDIKADDVAGHVGYSTNYFSAEFKKAVGVEFRKYLRDLRLSFSMNLLKFSSLSVTEVCFESGFNTLPHFSQTFKNKYGISPEKIREEK